MNEKLMLVGAGSAVFTKGLVSDLLRQEWEGELRLVDIDPKALAVAGKLAAKMLAAKKSRVKLSASVDRRELLPGATAVVCTIGVGGRRAWEQDVFIPRRHGIYQPVGDSVMPGGASRALRMTPAMVAIAQDVLDLCPEALFFNYGNPMGPVCRAVRKATGAEVVGLCHGVFSVAYELADMLRRLAEAGARMPCWRSRLRRCRRMSSGTSRKSLQRPAGSWCGDAWQHNCMIRRLAMSDFKQHDEKHP
jgi:alpha-galactosidase